MQNLISIIVLLSIVFSSTSSYAWLSGDEQAFIESTKRSDLERMEELVKGGFTNLEVKDEGGYNALHWSVFAKRTEVIEFLAKNKVDMNAKTRDGNTALYHAVFTNEIEVAQVLMDNGADVNVGDKYNKTPLHLAILLNRPKMAQFLIKNKADINAKDKKRGWTPLHHAISNALPKSLKVLMDNNADLKIEGKKKETPIDILNIMESEELKLVLSELSQPQVKKIKELMKSRENVKLKIKREKPPCRSAFNQSWKEAA